MCNMALGFDDATTAERATSMAMKKLAATTLPKDSLTHAEIRRIVRYQFIYSIVGVIFGASSMILGSILLYMGLAGNSSFTAKMLGADITISDAGPGTILFIVGLFVIFISRFDIKSN